MQASLSRSYHYRSVKNCMYIFWRSWLRSIAMKLIAGFQALLALCVLGHIPICLAQSNDTNDNTPFLDDKGKRKKAKCIYSSWNLKPLTWSLSMWLWGNAEKFFPIWKLVQWKKRKKVGSSSNSAFIWLRFANDSKTPKYQLEIYSSRKSRDTSALLWFSRRRSFYGSSHALNQIDHLSSAICQNWVIDHPTRSWSYGTFTLEAKWKVLISRNICILVLTATE